jgi:hypothetical protein
MLIVSVSIFTPGFGQESGVFIIDSLPFMVQEFGWSFKLVPE